ncbi:transposable element Tcb2 transposase [Trichonephila clavipes]|nr:transposable element Tcb2 transposase [Trichonephila clavipes]
MAGRNHPDVFTRERMIGKLKKGHSLTSAAEELGTNKSVIPRTWKALHTIDCYGGPGAVIWGGIMLNGRTELYVFNSGSVTGDRYCKEVILPHVPLSRDAIERNLVYMDANARTHQTYDVL